MRIARWLQKPVKQSDLLNALAEIFHRAPAKIRMDDDRIETRPAHVPAMRVLLAEDGVVNQRVATGFLEMRGHQVFVANNGKEALAALQREPFDLVLMDVHMPEMDGLEATRTIRRSEQGTGQHLRIIALTASAMTGDRENCLAAGMDAYLSKPFNANDLFRAVEQGAPASASPSASEPGAESFDEILNWEKAKKNLRGRAESLAAAFLEECPKLMNEMRAGVTGRDAVRIQRAAHTLRGSAEIFAARNVSQAAHAVETLARANLLDEIEGPMAELEREVGRLVAALQTLTARKDLKV